MEWIAVGIAVALIALYIAFVAVYFYFKNKREGKRNVVRCNCKCGNEIVCTDYANGAPKCPCDVCDTCINPNQKRR